MPKKSVKDHPKSAGRLGGRRARQNREDINAAFSPHFLSLLNASQTFHETTEQLYEALQAAPVKSYPPRQGTTLLTTFRGTVFYSPTPASIRKSRRLLNHMNAIGGVDFWEPKSGVPGYFHLLPLHFAAVAARLYVNALLDNSGPTSSSAITDRILRRANSALTRLERSLERSTPAYPLRVAFDLGTAAHNCGEAVKLLEKFNRQEGSLSDIRRCQNPRCLAPYFLRRMGPSQARYCGPACYSLARTPNPKRHHPPHGSPAFLSE